MNLSLLAPMGLVVLAALLLPLLLHLQRQSEARPTPFAALRWIGARLRPRRRIRLEELLLLLLRLLLVASVALLFARPVMTGLGADKPWVLVATTLDAPALRAAQSPAMGNESKSLAEAQWRWLAPDFPEIDAARPAPRQPTASLLRDVDARLPPRTAVTVFVPGIVDGLDGERPQLSRSVDWRVAKAISPPAKAGGPEARPAQKTKALIIRHVADRNDAARFLQAAARALARPVDAGDTTRALPAGARQLAWLVPGPVPPAIVQWLRDGGTLLLDREASIDGLSLGAPRWRDRQGRVLALESSYGRGRVIAMQSPLSAQSVPELLDAGFPDQLEALLDPPPESPARADAAAARPRTGGPGYQPLPEPVDAWLAWLAVALLLAERWIATRAKRGLAP
ncbi:MAG: BatA domain-containing protein [Gammaproteobacteria bacterium]|nr:BatA domain-containing protein [Gammaproteobacteria bacterium]